MAFRHYFNSEVEDCVKPNIEKEMFSRAEDLMMVDALVKNASVESALDVQIGGDHYKSFKIQPIEFIEANNLGFHEGNIIKYITRYATKNGKDDLEKAKHYIDLLIEFKYVRKDTF